MFKTFKQEVYEVSRVLEKHHSIFYKMWEFGTPELNKSVPTASVRFDAKSYKPLRFLFNPSFWDSLDLNSRAFIIAHECLHAMLNHGQRAKTLYENKQNKTKINIAMDLAVNHMLVNSFGFVRDEIEICKEGCWVENVFPNKIVENNLSFEEYYRLLCDQEEEEESQNKPNQEGNSGVGGSGGKSKSKQKSKQSKKEEDDQDQQGENEDQDDQNEDREDQENDQEGENEDQDKDQEGENEGQEDQENDQEDENEDQDEDQEDQENDQEDQNEDQDEDQEDQENDQEDQNESDDPQIFDDHEDFFKFTVDDLVKLMSKDFEQDELNSASDAITASGSGDDIPACFTLPEIEKMRVSPKWERIVKSWKRIGKNPPDDSEQWAKMSRRASSLPSDIILPSYDESIDDDFCLSKLNAWIFLDVSGSCIHLKDQFFMAYETISEKRFNKRMFIFADRVAEIDKNARDITPQGVGWGTSFYAIGRFVELEIEKTNIKPDIIMVITDGDAFHPEEYILADKWHWFCEDVMSKASSEEYRTSVLNQHLSLIKKPSHAHILSEYFIPPQN